MNGNKPLLDQDEQDDRHQSGERNVKTHQRGVNDSSSSSSRGVSVHKLWATPPDLGSAPPPSPRRARSSGAMEEARLRTKIIRKGAYHAAAWWVCLSLAVCACAAASDLWLWRIAPVVESRVKGTFSEERAFDWLTAIASMGPRCVGSGTLLDVYSYLQEQVTDMTENQINQNLSVEMNFTTSLSGAGESVIYYELPMLYVKLSCAESEDPSLLLIAHADSVCTGQGVSDNAYGVSEFLEIIYTLTSSADITLKSPIIFLFSVSEFGLPPVSGALRSLPWNVSSANAFLSFDSAGSAVEIALFAHADTMKLASPYENAPYPMSIPFFDDLFRHGFFLRTNNHIYDELGLPGAQFIHFPYADTYHTALDDLDHVRTGTLQADGENTMHLLQTLVMENTLSSQLEKQSKGDSVIWTGPGMLIVSRVNSIRVVWLSFTLAVLVGFGGCALLALAKEFITLKRLLNLGLVSAISLLYTILGSATGLGLSLLLGEFLSLANPFTYCSNYLEICLMCASCCVIGASLHSFLLEETIWQMKKRGKIGRLLPIDLQICCLVGVSIMYNIITVTLLAADYRFASIFIYPSLAGPVCIALQIGTKVLFTHITFLKLCQLKWYGRLLRAVVCQWVPFAALLAFPFFFVFPTIIFVISSMGPQLANYTLSGTLILCTVVTLLFMSSIQILIPYTHGGTTLTWGDASSRFANSESCGVLPEPVTHIQGSRSTGLWVVAIFFATVAMCLFVASMCLAPFTEYVHLKYYASMVHKPTENDTYIVVVPATGDSTLHDYLSSFGYNSLESCPSFWSGVASNRIDCYPAELPSTLVTESITQEEYFNTSTSTRNIELSINGTRFPWITLYFDQEVSGDITFDGVQALGTTLQANEPFKYYSGNPDLHQHNITIALPYHTASLVVNVLCQSPDVDPQISQLWDDSPVWSLLWGPDYQPTVIHLVASFPAL
ncbi:hypothetical protein Pelo_12343 [Pelomyxa schiedti]|nr:hypothetical protein Pelo_12343 [Pelomyxa schiedti]